jgi:pyruvate kinase
MASELVARHLKARAVVAATMSGETARFVSMSRPGCPVIGMSPLERTRRRVALYRGVIPAALDEMADARALAAEAARLTRELLGAEDGLAVLVYGEPVGSGVKANTVRLVELGRDDAAR